MSTVYEDAVADALETLTEYGKPLTFRRYSSDFDPVTSAQSNQIVATQSLYGIKMTAKHARRLLQEPFDNALLEGLISGSVKGLLVAASGASFVPRVNDVAAFDSCTWRVLGCTVVAPADVNILFKILVALNGETVGAVIPATWDEMVMTWDEATVPWDQLV